MLIFSITTISVTLQNVSFLNIVAYFDFFDDFALISIKWLYFELLFHTLRSKF